MLLHARKEDRGQQSVHCCDDSKQQSFTVCTYCILQAVNPSCNLYDAWTSFDPASYMRQLCAPGYYGPVCSLCVASGDQTYGRVGSLQCKPCRSTAAIISAYVASALAVLAWLSYTVHVTLVENEEAAAGHSDSQRTSQLIRVST